MHEARPTGRPSAWHYRISRPGVRVHIARVNSAVGVTDALLRGVGQVMRRNNPSTGLLFLVGMFLNSYDYHGLHGLNAVLTGRRVLEWQSTIYAFIGAISSAIVFAVIAVAPSPIGMPA